MSPSSTTPYPFMARKGAYLPKLTAAAAPAPSWTPASLPSLVGWYDASVASSITASGGAVSQWNDLSGNGFHLTQGTGSLQPITGTLTQNGLNVIKFDGVDDKMNNASSTAITASNCSLYIVLYYTAGNVGGTPAIVKLGSPDTIVGLNVNNTRPLRFKNDANVDFNTTGNYDAAAHQVTLRGGGSSTAHIYVDGTQDGTGTTTATFPEQQVTVGGTLYASTQTFWIAEMFYASARNTDADKASAESYLKTKWGTP